MLICVEILKKKKKEGIATGERKSKMHRDDPPSLLFYHSISSRSISLTITSRRRDPKSGVVYALSLDSHEGGAAGFQEKRLDEYALHLTILQSSISTRHKLKSGKLIRSPHPHIPTTL